MVSIKTGLTLGLIAAFVLFSNQIGTALGKGIRGFGESALAGITNPLSAAIPTVVTAATPANDILTNLQKQAGELQKDIEKAIQYGTNLGGSVNPEASASGNIATSGGTPTVPQASTPTPTITGLAEAALAGVVSTNFAGKYSGRPEPTQSNVLDVSKAFNFIANTPPSPSRAASNYGGHGSAINQNTALAQAIQASARENPSYFG
jgi:hypothetical protein|tara:strand:+ start:267 stop:884 length:618 start_codon:yes stop_codon:yes gene_type:complete